MKAIALQESGWEQYWGSVPKSIQACDNYDGTNVKLGYDCIGIGIMQISDYRFMKDGPEKDAYIDRLKTDIRFNIQEGIKILNEKWGFHRSGIIPTINDNDPLVIENWYFAVMAYNGMLPRNNPLERPFSPYGAYQEEVFELLNDYTLIDINPFPTHLLDPYTLENGQLRFETLNFKVTGPQHYSSQSLVKGDTAYTTAQSLNIRNAPNGDVIGSLSKGSKVTITGGYAGNNSKYNQYVWLPIRTSNGQNAWVSSSYLNKNDYIDVHRLEGYSRYDTSVSIANHGWHWDQPTSVVIGRGDDPIDALTGSVLASGLDSPLILTKTKELPASVERELNRLNPTGIVYILGGENVISEDVENKLKQKFGNNRVIRIAGYSRFETASKVAKEVDEHSNVSEVIVTTGDSNSSDPLAIAPYAGENNIPILLTGRSRGESLNKEVRTFIQDNNIKKVTIIGGELAVSKSAEAELQRLVGSANVKRVFGKSRFDTNIAIINTFYDSKAIDKLLVSQGMETADALSASPFAAKLEAPIVLTQANKLPAETKAWLNGRISTRPNLYFLGGNVAINENVRNEIVKLIR
ncbi:SH3 domain-containing protein [Oceanobacillus sp. 143]|nr:SH3 domain-containing protein [Oceanobacillus sp. 143]